MYNDLQCKTEVEMMEPEDPIMKGAVQAMRDSGVEVYAVFNRLPFFSTLFCSRKCTLYRLACPYSCHGSFYKLKNSVERKIVESTYKVLYV